MISKLCSNATIAELALLVVIFTVHSGAIAGEVFVSNEKQLEKAVAAAAPGDTVVIRDGTWTDWIVKLRASGTPEQPVTVKAQTPGRVRLTGKVRVEISGSHLVVTGLLFQECPQHQAWFYRRVPQRSTTAG